MSTLPDSPQQLQPQLFGGYVENNFSSPILRAISLALKYHLILQMIKSDQDAHGLNKKKRRVADENWRNESGANELFSNETEKGDGEVLELSGGRKRMDPMIVFIFIMVRGYLGSIKDRKSIAFIQESKFLESILRSYGVTKIPGISTILDNLNLLSEDTLRAIHKLTLEEALVLEIDDFSRLYFDSTRISASSSWPTESRTIADLFSRIRSGLEIFSQYGIRINFPKETDSLIEQINASNTSIALRLGQKGSKKHIKKMYRKILRNCKALLRILRAALLRAVSKIGNILPSIKEGLEGLAEHIEVDLHNVELCADNAKRRVLKGEKIDASQKVLGIADPDAEIIAKGNRPPVFGYKPQVGRSESGLIVSALVPQGSASDSGQMREITDAAISNTGVMPIVLSYDDGYTNKKERGYYLDNGAEVVSFSGAKGKAQTEDVWDQEDYIEARNKRSMVESTMSTLKGVFDLQRFTRRGRDKVTQELLTAVIFHNIDLIQRKT